MRAKIVQISVVQADQGSNHSTTIFALDEFGQLWRAYANNARDPMDRWASWERMPSLPEDSYDPAGMLK